MIVFSYVLPELFHSAKPLLFSMFPKTMGGTETGTCTPELSLRRLTLVDIPLPGLRLVTRVWLEFLLSYVALL